MSYYTMDHAAWLAAELRRDLGRFEAQVAHIVGLVAGGCYNAPVNWKKVEWITRGGAVAGCKMIWARELCTWDFSALTTLVLLAHEACIRVSIAGVAPGQLRMTFHAREREGNMPQRHPTIGESIDALSHNLALWSNGQERHPVLFDPERRARAPAAASNRAVAEG